MKSDHILTTNSVSRTFFLRRSFFNKHNKVVYAVNQVSLGIKKGQTLGIVGESGCGKSTLAKMIVMLDQPTGGGIFFNGGNVPACGTFIVIPFRRAPGGLLFPGDIHSKFRSLTNMSMSLLPLSD